MLKPQKHNRMESFYRKMRKRFDILMENGNHWPDAGIFDTENRQKLKPVTPLSKFPSRFYLVMM